MTDITFCRPGHNYESYYDFWRLVELSGFPIIPVSELDISKPGVYITAPMNRDWRNHINAEHKKKKNVNAHLILWNLERPSGDGAKFNYAQQCRYLFYGQWENGKFVNEEGDKSYGRFIDDVWVSDRLLADETTLRFVVLGSDSGLGEPGPVKSKIYKFCHMSYEIPRRTGIYKHFNPKTIGPNAWPPERDGILKASRFAVNVHQDGHPFQEPLRFALFAAYGLPIISETIFDSYPWSEEFMIYSGYDGLVGKINQVLDNDYEQWIEMAQRARQRMCHEFRFKDMVIEAVEQSVGVWR